MYLVRFFFPRTPETPEAKMSQNTVVLAQNPTGFIPHSSKLLGIWDIINIASILSSRIFPLSYTQTGVHSGC